MPYSLALRFINPYKFSCPMCKAPLRSKKATLFLAGCVIMGVILGVFGGLCDWKLVKLAAFEAAAILIGAWAWHFYIWKTDSFFARGAPSNKPDAGNSRCPEQSTVL